MKIILSEEEARRFAASIEGGKKVAAEVFEHTNPDTDENEVGITIVGYELTEALVGDSINITYESCTSQGKGKVARAKELPPPIEEKYIDSVTVFNKELVDEVISKAEKQGKGHFSTPARPNTLISSAPPVSISFSPTTAPRVKNPSIVIPKELGDDDTRYGSTGFLEKTLLNFVEKLKNIKQALADKAKRHEFLDSVVNKSEAPITNGEEELDSLINDIIKSAYGAGRTEAIRKAAASGRVRSRNNSDEQAIKLAPVIEEIHQKGITTLQGIADELNGQGIKTRTDHEWYPSTVKLLIESIERITNKPIEKPITEHDKYNQGLIPVIKQFQSNGLTTYSGIAKALNEQGIKTRNGHEWYGSTVKLLIQSISASEQQQL